MAIFACTVPYTLPLFPSMRDTMLFLVHNYMLAGNNKRPVTAPGSWQALDVTNIQSSNTPK